MTRSENSILIMGTRGVPASHGGFETFAEPLALFLVERGWNVSVYGGKGLSAGAANLMSGIALSHAFGR